MNDFLTVEASYEEGYDAGKQAAAENIIDEIETLAYAVGERSTIQIFHIRQKLDELKEKYGVQ